MLLGPPGIAMGAWGETLSSSDPGVPQLSSFSQISQVQDEVMGGRQHLLNKGFLLPSRI